MENDRQLGPNIKKLLSLIIARESIPPGSKQPFEEGLEFFLNAEHRKVILERSMEILDTMIKLIREAPDNPYGEDEEKIAEAIVKNTEKRELKKLT